MGYQQLSKIAGWTVFGIATIIYALTAEPTGSLWDCGEFITGAYKFEVVHPPGAPIFLMIGRMFTLVADLVSNNPEDISYSINFMSGFFTALAAAFVCWTAIIFGKLALVGREGETDHAQNIALAGTGLVAGLTTAFCTSIWFSAVEGEVYAMSTFFTTTVVWGMSKWYSLPNKLEHDRWIVFSLFMAGMSIGVHLLSLLTLPAMAILFYLKKYKQPTWAGMAAAFVSGVAVMVFIQYFIIVGIPTIWTKMELMMVNGFGMPQHSGLVPTVALLLGIIGAGLYFAPKLRLPELQYFTIAFALILSAFSTIGVVVIRASANTPINMNNPSNAMRLLPYINREQYGERPLLYGPHFDVEPNDSKTEDRMDYVEEMGRYEVTDQKISYEYPDNNKTFFPRISHSDRRELYMQWFDIDYARDDKGAPLRDSRGKEILARQPNMGDNFRFFFNYQIGWMYFRYFMWNFSGRQNGQQGYFPWDPAKGHWISGIKPLDAMRTHNYSAMTDVMKNDRARNTYFMLPFIFGLVGIIFLFRKRPNDAIALIMLFLMTGLAIIVYSNQPPNEPRERDYVLVGSFFTYAMWVGLGVLGIRELLLEKLNMKGVAASAAAIAVVAIAPLLMGFQNYDDHSRADHYGARDYASNFLHSVEKDAIIFTYGDNDTYPLWYAQEVEGIRTDVRVVNLSLIQVDWYIDQLRRKVNNSEALEFTVPQAAIRGGKRSQFLLQEKLGRTNLKDVLKFLGEDHPVSTAGGHVMESFLPTKQFSIPVDSMKTQAMVSANRRNNMVKSIDFNLPGRRLLKGDMALLDIVASNFGKRPIYFAVTVRRENLLGLQNHLQLEGLALKLVPVRTPPDEKYQGLGSLGMGHVDSDRMFNNVMKDWRWGGFDKKPMFVDDKYGPSVQSMHYAMLRGAENLVHREQYEKATQLVDKYFEAFPHFNFPYDYTTTQMIELYPRAGAYEKAKPHIATLLDAMEQDLIFCESLNSDDANASSFRQKRGMAAEAVRRSYMMARNAGDNTLVEDIKKRFQSFGVIPDLGELPPPPQKDPDLPDSSKQGEG